MLRKNHGADDSAAALLGKGNDASSAPNQPWFRCPRRREPLVWRGLAIGANCCSQPRMTGSDPDALTRIDAAIERIERATAMLGDAHRGLRQRHARLRQEVAGTLADLDALIADRAEVPVE
jgi:hypothetical protein